MEKRKVKKMLKNSIWWGVNEIFFLLSVNKIIFDIIISTAFKIKQIHKISKNKYIKYKHHRFLFTQGTLCSKKNEYKNNIEKM